MRPLVKKFNDLHPTLKDKEKMSKDEFIKYATKMADMRDEVLSQFEDEDWEELFKLPYPIQYRIALGNLKRMRKND